MNTTIAIAMIIVAGVGGLFMAGAWVAREFNGLLPALVFGGLGLTAALWAACQLLAGVFSAQGLAYSFGLADAGNLTWPTAVRITTLALATELLTLAAWAADYLADRGPLSPLHAWLWAHVSGPCRIAWHAVVAPAMALRDRVYRRLFAWPVRPRHRFELAAILGELVGDIVHLVPALWSVGRRLEWRKLLKVTRTRPVPDTAKPVVVVDGESVAGEILHTWRALDAAPTPRDTRHKART
ncbi:MAG: hypothetical protein ACRD0H_17875 [Actinomycetes bacterium]